MNSNRETFCPKNERKKLRHFVLTTSSAFEFPFVFGSSPVERVESPKNPPSTFRLRPVPNLHGLWHFSLRLGLFEFVHSIAERPVGLNMIISAAGHISLIMKTYRQSRAPARLFRSLHIFLQSILFSCQDHRSLTFCVARELNDKSETGVDDFDDDPCIQGCESVDCQRLLSE